MSIRSYVAVAALLLAPCIGLAQTYEQWERDAAAKGHFAPFNNYRDWRNATDNKLVSDVLGGTAPADHRARIDEALADLLLDPDSRRVAFAPSPIGGLVCGTVNAKNRMGGYVGPQPFYAAFDATGRLTLKVVSDDQLREFKLHSAAAQDGFVPIAFLRRCGFVF